MESIGQCKMGCSLCHSPYCELVKRKCAVCGEEFVVGELFTVDGKNMCLRCKTEKEEREEIERVKKREMERLDACFNLSREV